MEKLNAHLKLMSPEQEIACRNFLNKHAKLLETAAGSTHNHQSWPGGYLGHVEEVLSLAVMFYEVLEQRPLYFALSDALFVLFWHDCEKPWRIQGPWPIEGLTGRYTSAFPKEDILNFQMQKMRECGADVLLTPEMENALKYVEGEKGDYSQGRRTMGELAAFCHICDVASARIFYDYPEH